MGFAYHRPDSLAEALSLKSAAPDARFIAGGTDLMVQMRAGAAKPAGLISLRGIEELRTIEVADTTRIGALVTVSELLAHPALGARFGALVAAARVLGSVQIRNLATVGGNLCNASPAADLAVALLVHDARVRLVGPDGERELPLDDFFVGPGQTVLGKGELLAEILLEEPPGPGLFLRRGRVRMDIAIASVAGCLDVQDGTCRTARIAAGSVAPRPVRLRAVEKALVGHELSEDTIRAAREAAQSEVEPITDLRASAGYRRHLVGVYVERAVRGPS